MKHVYEKLRLGNFEHCFDAMNRYVHNQKNYRTLEHKIDETELCNVEDKLALYINYWKEIKQRTLYETITY